MQKNGFIIGTILFFLFFLSILFLKNNLIFTSEQEGLIVDTQDPLVSRQLSQVDLLPEDRPLVTFIDPQRGAENPTIILVEFSDFSCPFCAEAQNTIEQIFREYPQDILHVWKDAPHSGILTNTMSAHLAARCAGKQQKFWEYAEQLFENQNNFTLTTFQQIGRSTNLNLPTWQRCFDQEEEIAKIERGLTEAEVLGIDSTPYFFINERRLSGAVAYEEFVRIIEEELAQTPQVEL